MPAFRDQDSKVRAKRIGVTQSVDVESRTLGTLMTYNMSTGNVSRSGLLLQVGTNRKVPYLVNTIVELTVDKDCQMFDRPVSCLGKVVRVTLDGERRPQYGVQIIQLDGDDLSVWEKGVNELESSSRALLPGKVTSAA